jgi:predicted RNA-binding Zn ribbon-like protein
MAHYTDGLGLATALVNSFDEYAGEDQLESVSDLVDFARAHGFDAAGASSADLERLHLARPVLRHAMLSGDEAAAVDAVNELIAVARPCPQLVRGAGESWVFQYADPAASLADRILAEAAAEVLREISDHGMRRFSTCNSSTCADVFVDLSRNHSRRYCSPDVCGNREAQRAYRARQTGRAG